RIIIQDPNIALNTYKLLIKSPGPNEFYDADLGPLDEAAQPADCNLDYFVKIISPTTKQPTEEPEDTQIEWYQVDELDNWVKIVTKEADTLCTLSKEHNNNHFKIKLTGTVGAQTQYGDPQTSLPIVGYRTLDISIDPQDCKQDGYGNLAYVLPVRDKDEP